MKRVVITSIEREGSEMVFGGEYRYMNHGATVGGTFFTGRAAFEFTVFLPLDTFAGMTIEQAIIKELNAN